MDGAGGGNGRGWPLLYAAIGGERPNANVLFSHTVRTKRWLLLFRGEGIQLHIEVEKRTRRAEVAAAIASDRRGWFCGAERPPAAAAAAAAAAPAGSAAAPPPPPPIDEEEAPLPWSSARDSPGKKKIERHEEKCLEKSV